MSDFFTLSVVSIGEVPAADLSEYRPLVLVVDDEPVIADRLTAILTRSGYAAMAVYDGAGALETALLAPPDVVISDVGMPGMNGIELAIAIERMLPECKILLFSGQSATVHLLADAETAGHHFTLITKPVHPRDLLMRVAATLSQARCAIADARVNGAKSLGDAA